MTTTTKETKRLTRAQCEALIAYAAENGRTWKSKLAADWQFSRARCIRVAHSEYRAELQQVRNALGPRWLHRVTIDEVSAHYAELRELLARDTDPAPPLATPPATIAPPPATTEVHELRTDAEGRAQWTKHVERVEQANDDDPIPYALTDRAEELLTILRTCTPTHVGVVCSHVIECMAKMRLAQVTAPLVCGLGRPCVMFWPYDVGGGWCPTTARASYARLVLAAELQCWPCLPGSYLQHAEHTNEAEDTCEIPSDYAISLRKSAGFLRRLRPIDPEVIRQACDFERGAELLDQQCEQVSESAF